MPEFNKQEYDKVRKRCMLCVVLLAVLGLSSTAQDLLQLPPPRTDGGRPLMQVLKERKSAREFSTNALPPQLVSDLLWAAFGINRSETGRRTAPSARNWQEIDVYVSTAEGLFIYDAKANALKTVLGEDVRALCGVQPYVKDAPLNLVFVADFSRMGEGNDDDKKAMAYADAGFISQNVYLFCASEGLATVIRASIDRPALAKKMKLSSTQNITLAQTVGYPQ
jgi:nitroreductase